MTNSPLVRGRPSAENDVKVSLPSGAFGWLRTVCVTRFQINIRAWLIKLRLILDVRLFWFLGKGLARFQVTFGNWLLRLGRILGVRLFWLLGKGVHGRHDASERGAKSASVVWKNRRMDR